VARGFGYHVAETPFIHQHYVVTYFFPGSTGSSTHPSYLSTHDMSGPPRVRFGLYLVFPIDSIYTTRRAIVAHIWAIYDPKSPLHLLQTELFEYPRRFRPLPQRDPGVCHWQAGGPIPLSHIISGLWPNHPCNGLIRNEFVQEL
jgi:hypothetical protein